MLSVQNLDQRGWYTISSTVLCCDPQVGEYVPFIHNLSGCLLAGMNSLLRDYLELDICEFFCIRDENSLSF